MRQAKDILRKLFPLALCVVLVCGLAPTLAFADEGTGTSLQATDIVDDDDSETDELDEPPVPITPEEGSIHKVSGSTYEVTSNTKNTVTFMKAKNAKTVTVPATVVISGKTYKVTDIAAKAFAPAKEKLVTVTIGENVKTIGASAFSGCVKLKNVKGGASVKTIGASAFSGSTSLVTVTIGKNVKTIGAKAFSGCKKLKTVKGGASVKTIGKLAFNNCKVMTKCLPFSSKKLVKVGASVVKNAKKFKTMTVKSKNLKKKSVKKSLKGSSVKVVKVKVGKAKANKTYVKKYNKIFTKANCGKKVTVK